MSERTSNYRMVDIGPFTIIFLSVLLLTTLKLLGHITLPWYMILSPVLVVVFGSAIIILYTLVKMLKNYFFN